MTQICTTIEQSKTLVELGIDVSTADMHYTFAEDFSMYILYADNEVAYCSERLLPAWSLSALLDLIPDKEPLLQKIEGTWTITINTDEEHLEQFSDKTLIGTLYEAIEWLAENNYIKKNM